MDVLLARIEVLVINTVPPVIERVALFATFDSFVDVDMVEPLTFAFPPKMRTEPVNDPLVMTRLPDWISRSFVTVPPEMVKMEPSNKTEGPSMVPVRLTDPPRNCADDVPIRFPERLTDWFADGDVARKCPFKLLPLVKVNDASSPEAVT